MPYGFIFSEWAIPNEISTICVWVLEHIRAQPLIRNYNGAFNRFLQNNRDTWNICFDILFDFFCYFLIIIWLILFVGSPALFNSVSSSIHYISKLFGTKAPFIYDGIVNTHFGSNSVFIFLFALAHLLSLSFPSIIFYTQFNSIEYESFDLNRFSTPHKSKNHLMDGYFNKIRARVNYVENTLRTRALILQYARK